MSDMILCRASESLFYVMHRKTPCKCLSTGESMSEESYEYKKKMFKDRWRCFKPYAIGDASTCLGGDCNWCRSKAVGTVPTINMRQLHSQHLPSAAHPSS